MASAAGFSVPTNEGRDDDIEIMSFQKSFKIPGSHVRGKLKSVDDYENLGKIAEGSFGVLWKCKNKKTQEIVFLKEIPLFYKQGFPLAALREVTILDVLKHDNIVKYFGTVAGRSLERNYRVMEYSICTLKDLFDKNVDAIHQKPVVKFISKQVLEGLYFIHSAHVVHRNINPENIIFTEKGLVKITGFDASRFYGGGAMTPNVNDLMYRSPEILFGVKSYNLAVDMWSIGCVIAYLLLKKPLFVGESEIEILNSIFEVLGTPSENIWPGFDAIFALFANNRRQISHFRPYSLIKSYFADESSAAKDIVQNLLVYCPEGRPKASDCLTSLYFAEYPPACSSDFLVPVIQNAGALGESTEFPLQMKSTSEIKAETRPKIKAEVVSEIKVETGLGIKSEAVPEVKAETGAEVKAETGAEVKAETGAEVKAETGTEVQAETGPDIKTELVSPIKKE